MEYLEWLDSLIRYKENRKNESTSSVSREKGARDRRTLVRLLACGMRLGTSDSLGSSFGREIVFPIVAVFNFMIPGHIWCLCPGQEQSELSGVPVIFEWFYIHLGVPGSWVCQSKHIQLHGIFFFYPPWGNKLRSLWVIISTFHIPINSWVCVSGYTSAL